MKKTKLFLFGALLIGIGSAFTTVKHQKLTVAYGTENGGATWNAVDPADINVTFVCNSGSSYCLYASPDLSDPIGTDATKQFQLIEKKK